ncbi:hypothetical protein ACFL6I_15540 [candidate division KSB1 bacterium]
MEAFEPRETTSTNLGKIGDLETAQAFLRSSIYGEILSKDPEVQAMIKALEDEQGLDMEDERRTAIITEVEEANDIPDSTQIDAIMMNGELTNDDFEGKRNDPFRRHKIELLKLFETVSDATRTRSRETFLH